MNIPFIISYRLPSQRISSISVEQAFWEIDQAAKLAGFPDGASYHAYLVPRVEFSKQTHTCRKHLAFEERDNLPPAEDLLPIGLLGEYGEVNSSGKPRYTISVTLEGLLLSLVTITFHHVALDGIQLYCGDGADIHEELQDYKRAKELMERMGAEECWGAPEDHNEYVPGYSIFYAHDMVSFHFRRSSPQLVVGGLEEGIRPTRGILDERDQAPDIHGYRREYARMVNLPWNEYWPRIDNGEFLACHLFTEEEARRHFPEQEARRLKAEALQKTWRKQGEYPIREETWSLE